MANFTNLKDLEDYLLNNIYKVLDNSMDIERVLADEMAKAVVEQVYEAYTPEVYERRLYQGGLSDSRNMSVTDVSIENGQVRLKFANLTTGVDSMKNEYIGDLIEYGARTGNGEWGNPDGKWAEARPFSEKTVENINNNPEYLISAIKKGLNEIGIKTK